MAKPVDTLIVFCSCPDIEVAKALARKLVETNLAACVNVLPGLRSFYQWQGKLCDESECLLLIKTSAASLDALQAAILAIHPYELPEVIAVPISAGLPAYLDWILTSVKDPA